MPTAPATTTATQSEGRPVRSNRMQGGHAVQLQITGEAVSKPTRKPRKENTIPDATPTNPMAPPEPHIQTRRRRKAQPADSDDAHAEHDPPIASQPVRYNAKEGDRFGYRKPQASPPPSPSPPPPSSTPAPVSVKIGPPRRKLAPTPDIPQDNEEREDSGLSGTAPDHANGGAPDEAAIEGGDGEDEEDDDSGAAAQDEVEWVPLSSQGDMVIDEQSDDEDEAQARRNLLLTPAPFDISMDLEPFEEPMDHVPTKATPSRAKQTDTNKRRRNEDDVVDEVGADVVDEAGAEEPRTPPPHHVGLSDGDDSEDPEPVVLSYRERNRGSNLPRPTKKARKRSPSPLRHRTKPRDKKHRHSSHDSSKSRSKHSSQRHSSSRRSPSPISTDSSEDEGESKSKKRRDTQLKHYDPGWKKVLTTAKNYFRLHIAEERAFPDFEGGVSIGVKLLGKAVDEHNKKNTRVIAKAFNEDGMSRCIQKEGTTYRSTARGVAEKTSLVAYELEGPDHEAGDYLPEDLRLEAKTTADDGSFLHVYKADGITIHRNYEHDGIEDFCVKFYYKGSKALAKMFPDKFRHALPLRALAFGCIVVFHSLHMYARELDEPIIKLSADRYEEDYDALCSDMDDILSRPESASAKELQAYLGRIADKGRAYTCLGLAPQKTTKKRKSFPRKK